MGKLRSNVGPMVSNGENCRPSPRRGGAWRGGAVHGDSAPSPAKNTSMRGIIACRQSTGRGVE